MGAESRRPAAALPAGRAQRRRRRLAGCPRSAPAGGRRPAARACATMRLSSVLSRSLIARPLRTISPRRRRSCGSSWPQQVAQDQRGVEGDHPRSGCGIGAWAAAYPFTMDPYAVLGVERRAPRPTEVARAYRATRQGMAPGRPRHRGRAAADGADQRRLRADPRRQGAHRRRCARRAAGPASPAGPRRKRAGHWLGRRRPPRARRRAAGRCSRTASPIELVTRTSTWASPQALLAVT